MRVVTDPPHIEPWQYKCDCGATLEATEDDIHKKTVPRSDYRESWTETTYVTICPLCKTTREVEKLPPGWVKLHPDIPFIT